jgi:hypothetical protein
MKPLPLLAATLGLAFASGCSGHDPESAKARAEQKPAEPESRVKQSTNGAVVVTVDEATQRLMDLQTAALAPARLTPEIKAYGRVLDTTPLVPLNADLISAQTDHQAAQTELERVKALAAQSNASQRTLETVTAAASKATVQLDSVRARLASSWGSAIAGRDDLNAFVQRLSTLADALVEVELPAGESLPTAPKAARLLTLTDPTRPLVAQWLGPAPSVDPQMQSRGFLFLLSPNSTHLAPGAAVSAFLELTGEGDSGVAVPAGAILRFNGFTWVYRQAGSDAYERVEVALQQPLDQGWFVRNSLQPQDKVVVVGAQQLLSEELKGRLEAP